MPRFVILEHVMPEGRARGRHWDLLLENGDALRTWAFEDAPAVGTSVPAEQLADHRLLYLDYEGPVSGNRGQVSRWDAGTYHIIAESAQHVTAILMGRRLQANLSLRQVGEDTSHWRGEWTPLVDELAKEAHA